ncbi:MAG: substrate-binding domain-containing protein [Acidobacteriia bacterium]|nr:substrate-binding domain-containing protein [Terriglobia bacterium]
MPPFLDPWTHRTWRLCRLGTPRDIGLVTFDELTGDDLFSPAVTAVVEPAYEIGFRAAEVLINRIEGYSGGPITARLPARLEIRKSSCLVRSRVGRSQARP